MKHEKKQTKGSGEIGFGWGGKRRNRKKKKKKRKEKKRENSYKGVKTKVHAKHNTNLKK